MPDAVFYGKQGAFQGKHLHAVFLYKKPLYKSGIVGIYVAGTTALNGNVWRFCNVAVLKALATTLYVQAKFLATLQQLIASSRSVPNSIVGPIDHARSEQLLALYGNSNFCVLPFRRHLQESWSELPIGHPVVAGRCFMMGSPQWCLILHNMSPRFSKQGYHIHRIIAISILHTKRFYFVWLIGLTLIRLK